MKHLVLGGARSGKSRFAESFINKIYSENGTNVPPLYIATATNLDEEMSFRIAEHQKQRGEYWETYESPLNLATAIKENVEKHPIILVECLTLWLSNCLHNNTWDEERESFLHEVKNFSGRSLVLVGNEVGSGIVPMGQLSRNFVDESGRLHQLLAQACERVTLVSAGLPLSLKPSSYDYD